MNFIQRFNRLDLADRAIAGGVLLLVLCYFLVFTITPRDRNTFPETLLDALINVGALLLWAAPVWWMNLRVLLSRPLWQQAMAHPALGIAFAVAWYFSVTVLIGWRAENFSGAFSVRPFSYVAFVWQVFQGLTVYALLVALAVIRRHEPTTKAPAAQRLLIRADDELVSLSVENIVSIERAGDYAQLVTERDRHLTRKSLAELERQLPAGQFIRVHRSHLINLNALESAESIGGGRLRARLRGDVLVETSRAGAKLLRDRAG